MNELDPLSARNRPKPVVLMILDGWGHSDLTEHNAIRAASTPNMDALMQGYPHGLINASELHVGLPEGQMGNSEVGHMNIGSGRVLMQELPKIDAAIACGALGHNVRLAEFVTKVKAAAGTCHLMGLLSDGGVHAHQRHIAALAKIVDAQGLPVRIHAFLDGRDTPPQSAQGYLDWLEGEIAGLKDARIATVSGRYYAMDRDQRWDRVARAYEAIAEGKGISAPSADAALAASYAAGKNDEFVLPSVMEGYTGVKNGDGILMANFRADRAREILMPFLNLTDAAYEPSYVPLLSGVLGMVEYSAALSSFMPSIFPPEKLSRIFGEIVSEAGLTQLRIAETEKYAHVTFFFNGGREAEFPGESRILVPSPKVATYDEKPEMSAPEVTDKLVEAIEAERFDVIVVNYANTDMVGHTGNIDAAIRAVEAVDACVGRVAKAALAKGGALLITADHGNAEQMHDAHTHQAHTAHTLNLVPVILASAELKGKTLAIPQGKLGDVAPTLLQWLGITQPKEMTGRSLLAA